MSNESSVNIVYEPTERQSYFHTLSDDYIVLGGSRGSGKSLCVIVEALGLAYGAQLAESKPWKCLILRRTIPQLMELLARAKDMYPKIIPGIQFNAQKNLFTLPSGGFIQFASCERDAEIEQYRGREFNMIIVDELSHFENDYVWNWLKSCNRNSHGWPNRMIGTSNPCQWVKAMCKVDDYGHDTLQISEYYDELSDTTIRKSLRFVQMNLETNPHLSLDYRASLAQDIHNKDQFLKGMWTSPKIPGMVYELEIDQMIKENRLCKVPHDPSVEVYTAWDLGYLDNMVVLFFQYVGKEIHIINKIESNKKGLPEYMAQILKMSDDLGYRYAKHLLPHDAKAHELQTGLTREQAISKVLGGVERVKVLPRLGVEEGISKTKEIFPRFWIDKDIGLVEQLRTYRRRWNPQTQLFGEALHEHSSHAADAFRYISYYKPLSTGLKSVPFSGGFGGVW